MPTTDATAVSTTPEGAASARRRTWILITCCMSLFISTMNASVVNVALPALRRDLGASTAALQWTVDAFTLVVAAFLLMAGTTADRVGRRRTFALGLFTFALGSALSAMSPNVELLIAARCVQALGASMLNPVALSIITTTFTEPHARARAIGAWGAVVGVSLGVGPLVGGLLVDAFSWHAVFWMNVPVALAVLAMTVVFVPESRSAVPRRFDLPGQVLLVVLLTAVVAVLIEAPERGLGAPLTVGLGAAALFVVVERRVSQPVLNPRFFHSVPFTSSVITALALFAVQGGFMFIMSVYLQETRGFSPLQAGAALIPLALCQAVAAPVSGRLVSARGTRPPLVLGGLILAAAGCVLAVIPDDVGMPPLAGLFALIGLSLGLVNPPITTTAVAGMPLSQAGAASGVAASSRQVGIALGVALAGLVSGNGGLTLVSARPIWVAMALAGALITALGLLAATPWARRTVDDLGPLFEPGH
ncbi:MFS transporter [Actinomyces glycerinitolerans]|uniref:Sugar transport proteins signature 1 n=1 Tax=Actinomyces glycerinitolerans TaxID=1892869 RepID=A0A1M4S2C3_9ACTO|nr:MFS transporter [Actinomyces glycerinitolerans]SHE26362.1 sugar transport proteins signature 1 [Actinomyces glycerinitolerans]